jgi:Rrf2 family iron-sulfur cluster assembly transcriptional regulator
MELNTKGRYAVTAMADLAKFSAGEAVPLSAIAERQRISLSYLEQLFVKLRRAGLVESERGRAGGYRLARPANKISVADIMRAVEEGVRMTRCAGKDAEPCIPGNRCLTHGLWDALGEQIAWFLDSVTLEEVIGGIAPVKIGRRPEQTEAGASRSVLQREGWREGAPPSVSPSNRVVGQ